MFDLIIKLYHKFIKKGHGLKPYEPALGEWTLGAIKGNPIQPDGQWDAYLPPDELQKRNGVETMNCTNYGTINALEILHNKKYGEIIDWSERFNGILSGTTINGNSPHAAAESFRNYGTIPEFVLPFNDAITSWSKYYSPKPMTQDLLDRGEEWKEEYEYLHEWVGNNPTAMMEALKYSPLGIPVYAWAEASNGMYYKLGQENHWTVCYGYEKGKYWKIYDSYPPHLKKIPWDNQFGYWCKRYFIERVKSKTELDKKFYDTMVGKLIMRVDTANGGHGELYEVHPENLEYITFSVSNKKIWDAIHKTLRPIIVGVTEQDFSRLKRVANTLGGIQEASICLDLTKYFID